MCTKTELGEGSRQHPANENPERQRKERGDDYGLAGPEVIRAVDKPVLSLYEALDGMEARLVREAMNRHGRAPR